MWKITLENDRMVFTPFFGDPDEDQDPDQLREELQDLKLENDRLQQREKLYQEFINFLDCHGRSCIRCSQYCPDGIVMCKLTLVKPRHDLINEFQKKLEELG